MLKFVEQVIIIILCWIYNIKSMYVGKVLKYVFKTNSDYEINKKKIITNKIYL